MTTPDPALNSGLSRRYLNSGQAIIGVLWNTALDTREIVGKCRQPSCGGLLQPLPTTTDGPDVWYVAECMNCCHEVASWNGLTLARSSRRSEMPDGAWARHVEAREQIRQRRRGHVEDAA